MDQRRAERLAGRGVPKARLAAIDPAIARGRHAAVGAEAADRQGVGVRQRRAWWSQVRSLWSWSPKVMPLPSHAWQGW